MFKSKTKNSGKNKRVSKSFFSAKFPFHDEQSQKKDIKIATSLPDKPSQRVQHLCISIGIHILPYLTVNTPNRIFYNLQLQPVTGKYLHSRNMYSVQDSKYLKNKSNIVKHVKPTSFKGSLTRDFRHQIFFHKSVSPRPLSIPLGPFRIFSKIRGYIRK